MSKYYIKLVFSEIELEKIPVYSSISGDSDWNVRYTPEVWSVPTLRGSKLFIFQNIRTALDFLGMLEQPWRYPARLPFMGITMWWCEAKNVEFPTILPFWGPPDDLQEEYWKAYPYIRPEAPKVYNQKIPVTLFADAVKLVHVVTESELTKYGNPT